MAILCGVTAMAGHNWPIYLGFKGGKGVATGAGIFFALHWMAGLIALGAFLLVFLLFRYVSLGSIVAAITMAAVIPFLDAPWPTSIFCAATAVLVVFRHRSNIQKLIKGTESRVSFSKSK